MDFGCKIVALMLFLNNEVTLWVFVLLDIFELEINFIRKNPITHC